MRSKKLIIYCIISCMVGYLFFQYPALVMYPFMVLASGVTFIALSCYAVTFEPLLMAMSRFSVHREYHAIIQKNYDERARLLQEVITLQGKLVAYKDLYASGITFEETGILCQVIYKQLHQKNSFFIVNKGSRHGVVEGMVALLNQTLLGRVIAVYPSYSKVIPVTDCCCHVPIVCATSGAHGVFRGNQLDFVSHLEPLVIDELVLTSGDGLIYPPSLALGRIKKFELNDMGFLYNVEVEPLYDIQQVTYCSLVSKDCQQALTEQ